MKRFVVLAFVLGCGGPQSPEPARPRPAEPPAAPSATEPGTPAPAELTLLAGAADALDASAASGCADRCCLPELPAWLSTPRDVDGVPSDALRRALDATKDPRVRGLALRWLALAGDPEDVERMARFAESAAPSAPMPRVHYGQAFQRCPPLEWEHPTLGRVALDGAWKITGTRFDDAATFAAWRAKHPRVVEEFDFWRVRPERISELRTRDPVLFVRVATMGEIMPRAPDAAPIVEAAKKSIGAARILEVLAGRNKWPEQEDTERHRRFCEFVLQHGAEIFEARDVPALAALWEPRTLRDDSLHASLGLTLARLDPTKAERYLEATLAQISYGGRDIVGEMTSHHFDKEAALLTKIMSAPAGDRTPIEYRVAVLRSLRDGGAASLARGKTLLAKAPRAVLENEEVTGELAAWAKAVDPRLELPREDGLRARPLKNMPAADFDAMQAKAAAARKDTVDRILAWLKTAR